jgi:hypothetical protein
MTTNRIFYINTPNDETLTVVAESSDEATQLAMEFCDDRDGDPGAYAADAGWESPKFWRWVGFDSLSDAEEQIRSLDKRSVTADRMLLRVTSRPGFGDLLWEVGARDEDWFRLPSCVLCGGAE